MRYLKVDYRMYEIAHIGKFPHFRQMFYDQFSGLRLYAEPILQC